MKAALPVLAATLALAACAPSAKAPPAPVAAAPPAARPAPLPAPAPVAQAPVTTDWADMPATPGQWRYDARGSDTEASFWSPGGMPMMRLRCLAESRAVVLSLPDSGVRAPVVTVRTETATRSLAANLADREMTAALGANDLLLDAMALSKGRFAVETDGLPPLYLPSHAEVSRVIEDCRG